MSPHRIDQYPPWANFAIRTLRALSCAAATAAGIGVLLGSTPSAKSLFSQGLTTGMGLTLTVFGTLCFLGTVTQRWVVEWVCMFFLSAAIMIYTLAIWSAAIGNVTKLAGAGAISMLVLLMLIRIVDLTVYWLQNVRAAKIKMAVLSDDD